MFFTYAYRSLLARLRATLVTTLAVGLFVAGGTLGIAYYLSLGHLLGAAPAENIIVVSKGAASEAESKLKLENARKLIVLEDIKKTGDQPLAVRELVSRVFTEVNDYTKYQEPTVIRGIDEHSLEFHVILLAGGAAPTPGSLEVIIGKRLAKQQPHLAIGSDLGLPGGAGKITGIFSAAGGPFEDEVWTPRGALELHISAKASSSVTLVASSAAAVPGIVDKINNSKDIDLQAASVKDFRADRAGFGSIAKTVLILLVLLSVVATFSIATTISAAVASRLPELAALAAIGIPKSTLGRIILIESALMALTGALLGALIGWLIASQVGRMPFGANPVELSFSPQVLLVGIGLGLLAGMLGGIIPALRVRRLDVLASLRAR